MNERILNRTRRQRYLVGIVSMLVTIIVISLCVMHLMILHNAHNGWILLLQCLIPLQSIILAGVFVSLPGKIVRSKYLLLAMFVLLVCLGMYVNSSDDDYSSGNIVRIILQPFNTTLASFFPSRGDYNIDEANHGVSSNRLAWYLIFHTLTYFYAAWLGFSLFGRKMLNRTALAFMPKRHKNLIWGYSEGALELAKDMIANTDRDEPIFILDDDIEFESEKEKRIFDKLSNESILAVNSHYGNLSESPEDFIAGWFCWRHWRRMLTTGKYFAGHRHYFITENQDFNVKYALLILKQLTFQKDSLQGKTHLFVRTEQEGIDAFFQEKLDEVLAKKVEVHIFNQSDITARQFVAEHPVLDLSKRVNPSTGEKWLTIHSDSLHVDGEINILMLGLGWTGYEMLRKQVCDAQFLGDYKINVVVVDNDYKMHHGRYQYIVQEAARFGVNICINPLVWIDKNHKISKQWQSGEKCSTAEGLEEKRIHQANGHLFYEWLGFEPEGDGVKNIMNFNRIIVALGSDELNINTALQLTNFRNHYLGARETIHPELMPEPIFAHVRDRESYEYYENYSNAPICIFGGLKSIYNAKNLVDEKMDKIAKLVNYVYSQYSTPIVSHDQLLASQHDGTAESMWAKCSIFDQDSSRAVALNIKNMITLAGGVDKLEAMIQDPLLIDRLSEMEHKRWNAFHYMRGIGVWPMEEVQTAVDNKGALKARGKLFFYGNLVRHICLVDYEDLDAATSRVNNLGNPSENFKLADQRIIRHFPSFYRIMMS